MVQWTRRYREDVITIMSQTVGEVVGKLNIGVSMRSVSDSLGSSNPHQIKTILENKLEFIKNESGQWVYMGNESDVIMDRPFPFKPYSKAKKEVVEVVEVSEQLEDVQTAPETQQAPLLDNEIVILRSIIKQHVEGKQGQQKDLRIHDLLKEIDRNEQRKKITPVIFESTSRKLDELASENFVDKSIIVTIAITELYKIYGNKK